MTDMEDFVIFIDDEIDVLLKFINRSQLCFHPKYAPEGQFSSCDYPELNAPERNKLIIADNNIVSPICEISRVGSLRDDGQLQKIAAFVTWSRFIHAQVSCGIGLMENDTAHKSTMLGEERKQLFLHALDNIPMQIWKEIAFGVRDCVPDIFLFKKNNEDKTNYELKDDFVLISNEAATAKIVQILRMPYKKPIDKFIEFMYWYADNFVIAESMVMYAALVFAGINNTSYPKGSNSKDYETVIKGIQNQAWDISYITFWSQLYYYETEYNHFLFATDDIMQKQIIIHIFPPGKSYHTLYSIFKEHKKLDELYLSKFGSARKRPFQGMNEDKKIAQITTLRDSMYADLKSIVKDTSPRLI